MHHINSGVIVGLVHALVPSVGDMEIYKCMVWHFSSMTLLSVGCYCTEMDPQSDLLHVILSSSAQDYLMPWDIFVH